MSTGLLYFSILFSIAVVIAAAHTAWYLYKQWKDFAIMNDKKRSRAEAASAFLLHWTIMDYALVALFGVGAVFLLADLVGVLRERELYPYYHYSYLVCGVVFSILGMLFMLLRLAAVLKLSQHGGAASSNDHRQPNHTDKSE